MCCAFFTFFLLSFYSPKVNLKNIFQAFQNFRHCNSNVFFTNYCLRFSSRAIISSEKDFEIKFHFQTNFLMNQYQIEMAAMCSYILCLGLMFYWSQNWKKWGKVTIFICALALCFTDGASTAVKILSNEVCGIYDVHFLVPFLFTALFFFCPPIPRKK